MARTALLLTVAALAAAPPASAQPIWTLDVPGRDCVDRIAAGPGETFLAAETDQDTLRSRLVRIGADGAAVPLARFAPRDIAGMAALPDGGALVTSQHELLRVAADGTPAPVAVDWPADAHPGAVAVAASGDVFVAIGSRVVRVAADGSATVVATVRDVQDIAVAPDGSLLVAETVRDYVASRVLRVTPDGTVTTLAGGGRRAPRDGIAALQARLGGDLAIDVGPGGSLVLVTAQPAAAMTLRLDGARLRVVTAGRPGRAFNDGDGRAAARATVAPSDLAVGSHGDVALADCGVRWISAPHAGRLAVAVTATRGGPPSVVVRATRRARLTVQLRRRGRLVLRRSATRAVWTLRLGALPAGRYRVRVDAGQGRAVDEVPLIVGARNPVTGADCERISARRVDCVHPEGSLNDACFADVYRLRADGQVYRVSLGCGGRAGQRVPRDAAWVWLDR